MKELIVLDYSTGETLLYNLPSSEMDYTEVEDFIESEGHRVTDCEWMVSDHIIIKDLR